MSLEAETVTQLGSGLVFNNTYGAGVTEAYRAAIVAAETNLQAQFTNPVSVALHFDTQSLGPEFSAQNTYALVGVSYADFAAALASHATTADDRLAVAGLPQNDPSHGIGFWISSAEARVLGLSTVPKAVDDTIVLNSDKWLEFGKDTVTTLEHEISEGVFGRVSSLGISLTGWQPMDLFRFTADGAHNYSGGADGQTAFFGLDGDHLSTLAFHNALNALGQNDGSGFNDWDTSADAFGPGGPGVIGDLSATDLQILDILGWTPAPPPPPVAPATPVVPVAPEPTFPEPSFHEVGPMNHIVTSFWGGWVDL
jgi:hypothetical protein